MADNTPQVEQLSDFGSDPAAVVRRWLAEITAYESRFKTWDQRSRKIIKRYRDEEEADTAQDVPKRKKFNILWSNIQTLQPALLAREPKPMVSRRNLDRDVTSVAATEIMQRALVYEQDECDYLSRYKDARDDYLLTARGQLWVNYVPEFGANKLDPEDQTEYRPVIGKRVYLDHVPWDDFGHTPAPKWEMVTAVWKRELWTRSQLIKRFKEKGKAVTLTKVTTGISKEEADKFGDIFKRGEVYAIWCKTDKKVYWISPGYSEGPLEVQEDPLSIEGFFPCPPPLYGTITTDTLVPVPDFLEYQSQALELDNLTARIDKLTAALRVAGAYDASFPNLENILKAPDNTLVPVNSWTAFSEKGGLAGAISFLPIQEVAEVLQQLIELRNQIKQDLYELTGLSDLIRGQSRPSATATAERIKGQYISMRLDDRRSDVERFLRNALRIAGEVIVEQFNEKELLEISGWLGTVTARTLEKESPGRARQVATAAIKLLKDNRLRSFKIDVETDSTALEDIEFERKTRIEFLTATANFMQQALPTIQQSPELAPLVGEMLMYGVRAFNKGADLEEIFEQTVEQLQQEPSAASQQMQAQMQEQQATIAELQLKQQQLQVDAQGKAQELQLKEQQQQSDQQFKVQELQVKMQELQGAQQIKMQELQLQMEQIRIQSQQVQNDRTGAEQRNTVELLKMQDAKEARNEDRANALEDQQMARAESLADRESDQQHEMNIRRLDGNMTPTMEEDMNDMAASIAKLADALVAVNEKQQSNFEELLKVLAAPRKAVRDPNTGQLVGAEIDMTDTDRTLN